MKTQKYCLDWIRVTNVNRASKRGEVLADFQSEEFVLESRSISMDVKRTPDGEIIHFLVKVGRERVEDALSACKEDIELHGAIFRVRRSLANKGKIIFGNYTQITPL